MTATEIFEGYKSTGESLQDKVIDGLLWARKRAPGAFVSHAMLTRAVHGYKRTPSNASKEVDAVKGACTRARTTLLRKHQCSMVAAPGIGVRLTVNDEDQARHELPGRVKRVQSATSALRASATIISPDKIKDSGLRTFASEVKGQSMQLDDKISRIRGLLAPKTASG